MSNPNLTKADTKIMDQLYLFSADLKTICKQTNLKEDIVKTKLAELIKLELVEKECGVYSLTQNGIYQNERS